MRESKQPTLGLAPEERAFLLAAAKEHSKPEWRKISFYIVVLGSIVAVLGLVISCGQVEMQSAQNAPHLALKSAFTVEGQAKGDGSLPPLLTTLTFQNTGGMQAQKLTFTSIGWYQAPTSVSRYDGVTGDLYHVKGVSILTSPWQKTSIADYLDKGQNTNHEFPDFPALNEPSNATNFLYVEGSYSDGSMWPLTQHYTEAFCLESVPNVEDGSAIPKWTRMAVMNCSGVTELEKQHPEGPLNDNE